MILRHQIPFYVPGFLSYYTPGDAVQSPEKIRIEEWYDNFFNRIYNSLGKEYLPVCRLSDGEFHFLFGYQLPSSRLKIFDYLYELLKDLFLFILKFGQFNANTLPNVSSGKYSYRDVKKYRSNNASNDLSQIAVKGILALHLSYGKVPFQEKYFFALGNFLKKSKIDLNSSNYVPFYFVYSLFSSEKIKLLLSNRKVLCVHSAKGDKKKRIIQSIENHNCQVTWQTISEDKSLFQEFNFDTYFDYQIDLILVGAGVGKLSLFKKLEIFNVPVIDVGYMFEVWNDVENSHKRPLLKPDKN